MKKTENECVGCTSMGLPCLGSGCHHRAVTRWYCDKCGDETQLYHFEDQELCIDCIVSMLEEVDTE